MNWTDVIPAIRMELVLIGAACALFLLGMSKQAFARQMAPVIALMALVIVFVAQYLADPQGSQVLGETIRIHDLGHYIKLLAAGVAALLVLLAWPTDSDSAGNSALRYGPDAAGEFFALLLLSISGIFLVAGANDMILLFLGIELASIPTYIMVSISRPLPVAQEAGVKYFFLGAMAAAVLIFGFSYLYGSTGLIDLHAISAQISATMSGRGSDALPALSSWQMLGIVMIIAALAFKIAAFPLHFYAGDVYEGAATPVTALLSFVPKTAGFVALLKVLWVISGGTWRLPVELTTLLLVTAALTMTVGNVLGLMQHNVKRVLAYSSIAHTGYMLVGVTAIVSGNVEKGISGVLFYLTAYGIMNVAAFGVLMLLPSRSGKPATSAETFEDLAGMGRENVGLGLAMAVACFSLTGLPLTVGFFGKLYLIVAALEADRTGLVIIMLINAAISAGYYLRIVATLFLRSQPQQFSAVSTVEPPIKGTPILVAVTISTILTLLLGTIFPATEMLRTRVNDATTIDFRSAPPEAVAQP